MRTIVLVSTSYPDTEPGADAAGSFVEDFAVELSRRVRVIVVAASRHDTVEDTGALSVRRFAVPRLPLSLLKPANPLQWPAIMQTLRSGRSALDAVLEQETVDHVLALWVLPSGWWAATTATSRGIAFSTWALGSDIWSLSKLPLIRRKISAVLRNARCRFADGLELCAEVEALSGLSCTFLPSSRRLELGRQAPVASQRPYKLAFLGRWHPNKGVDLLMQALGKLEDGDWENIEEVRIFGGGPLENRVHASGETLAAAGRPVTLGGFLDRRAAAELIAWADYQIVPSRRESIPVIYSDAVQLGTPVIATPVGDLPELIGRYDSGLVATSVDVDAITTVLREALGQDASRYCTNLARAAEQFDLADAAGRLLDQLDLSD